MKGKKIFAITAAILLGVTALAGCGKKKEPVVPDVPGDDTETNEVYGFSLSATDTEIVVGDTEYATVSVVAQGKDENLRNFSITSDNPEVLTVDPVAIAEGAHRGQFKLEAKTAGKAKLKVTSTFDSSITKELEIAVVDPYVKEITLSVTNEITGSPDTELETSIKQSLCRYGLSIKATVSCKDHNDESGLKTDGLEDITFASSNTELLDFYRPDEAGTTIYLYTVSDNVGTAKITVTSGYDDKVKAEETIYVVDPYIRDVSLNSNGLYLIVGDAKFGSADLEADITGFDFYALLGYPTFDYEVEFVSSDPNVATVDPTTGHVVAVGQGEATITATSIDGEDADGNYAFATCKVTVAPAGSAKPADGAYSYVYSDSDDRAEILGTLEKYLVENNLAGLTMYGDGGYQMYHESVQKGTNTYVPGFGFGTLSSGRLNADLEGETKTEWKRYYHTYLTDDPAQINYMDDKGSVVGNLIGYVSGSYFETYLNEEGNGYEWVKNLATKDRPIALNEDSHNMATKWRIPVKVGADVKYSTTSSVYSSYNNREVVLEDYITPYKIYYTQAYGLARSAENLTGAGSIKGTQTYYKASGNGFNATAWEGVGIKSGTDAGESYIEFEFNLPVTQFYAMYYLTSSMFAPVPEDFIRDIGGGDLKEGVKAWGKSSADGTKSPVDNWLCTGPYMFEAWDTDQQIVFKRNPNWNPEDTVHYQIAGVHYNILPAAKTDPEAGLNQFLAKKIHAVGIPSTKLDQYKNDPRTVVTGDDSTYKLNLNTCDQNTWNKLFGVNGTITQTPKSQYWACEPAMANKDFVNGLSFALNRKQLAETLGTTPSANFFGNGYMSDPENGVAYNSTEEHENAVKSKIEGTDGFGYSLEKAKASFKKAAEDLIEQGVYKTGDTIEIEIAWQSASQVTREHSLLKQYFEAAFNTDDNPLKLEVKAWTAPVWSDVYYKKMMVGQFDIGFGSISGNSLNPLSFLNVLSTDPEINEGFCLNWGLDTNSVDGTLVYGGEAYSFDALWKAADSGTIISQGANAPINYRPIVEDLDLDAAGNLVITIQAPELELYGDGGALLVSTKFNTLYFFGFPGALTNDEYQEDPADNVVKATDQTGVEEGYVRYVVTFNKDTIAGYNTANFKGRNANYAGIDYYYDTEFFGSVSEEEYIGSIYFLELIEDLSVLFPAP